MDKPLYLLSKTNNFLQLARPVIFFDLETTGTNVVTDRIVELFAIRVNADGTQDELHHYINPTVPIPPDATAVHGITDAMVKDKPTFTQLADELATFFEGCDLAGYNIKRFDVPLLLREFDRCKKYPINYNEVKLVDAMGIYHLKERRDLSAAVKFYCQREHVEAHSAKADVQATIDILKKQLLMYDDLQPNTSFLHDYLSAGYNVDLAGRFVRNEEGNIIFNFGAHKGREACTEPDYLKWIFENGDFPVDTRMVAKKIYMQCRWEEEIKAWIAENKLSSTTELLAALYISVKSGEAVFPFAVTKDEGKLTVTYLTEPPASYTCINEEAVKILLLVLDRLLREKNG
jgi:DNA polymerase-3 subunit epsilon